MKALVKSTGEVLELNPTTLEELTRDWLQCSEYEKAYKSLKEQMKAQVEMYAGTRGTTEPANGYMFRVSNIQRMNYDKSALRRVLDEDVLDLLLEPNKTAVDKYLKDNLETLGEVSTAIRESMQPVGKPYQVIRAEKVERTE